MIVQTFVNDMELIKSEMVHISENSEVRIKVENLNLIFTFENNDTKSVQIEKELVNKTELKIKFYNLSNPIGEGVLTPIEIGAINQQKLFLSFFVWTPNLTQSGKIFNYCLFLKK